MNESRLSIASLIVFFLLGIFVLTKVNMKRGEQTALAEEALMVEAH
jgi:MFS-type transporter involved in bile tolerance (Atg22 family)